MARWTTNRGAVPGWRVIGAADPASPWAKANETEREQARAVVREYAADSALTADQVARTYETRRSAVLGARWLAVASGLLEKAGDRFTVTDDGRKEIAT